MNPLVTEARALCEGATMGPWIYDERVGCVAVYYGEKANCIDETDGRRLFFAGGRRTNRNGDIGWEVDPQNCANGKIIARSRTLIPEMAAEIERLEMRIEFLLKVIADKEAEINHPRTYSSGGYVYHETAINWPGFDSRTDKPSPR